MTLVLLAAGTALFTTLLAPLSHRLLSSLSVLDVPNHRSSHDRPTVRGGGVACLGALVVVWVMATSLGVAMPHAALTAAVTLSFVGFADDVWGLPALARLLMQVVVGAALGAALGGPETALLGAVAAPVAVNAVNFMDGINGITALTLGAWATVVLLAGSAVSGAALVLAAMVLGQTLGFLPWNLPRATMFLGDSGSYLFGALVAASVLDTQADGQSYWLVIVPLGLYLFDTGYTLVRRTRDRSPVLAAHREHLYQRLEASREWSHTGVSVLVAGLSMLVGLLFLTLPLLLAGIGALVMVCVYARLATSDARVLQIRSAS